LGFAIGPGPILQRIGERLGPWAVSGPALAVGTRALSDHEWAEANRRTIWSLNGRLVRLLTDRNMKIAGNAGLFILVEAPGSQEIFEALCARRILVRIFAGWPSRIRFGLPADEAAMGRLHEALSEIGAPGERVGWNS
jgi:cobalamin biosynthetic protein CobC